MLLWVKYISNQLCWIVFCQLSIWEEGTSIEKMKPPIFLTDNSCEMAKHTAVSANPGHVTTTNIYIFKKVIWVKQLGKVNNQHSPMVSALVLRPRFLLWGSLMSFLQTNTAHRKIEVQSVYYLWSYVAWARVCSLCID